MENSVEPDQLASQKPADLVLLFQNRIYPGLNNSGVENSYNLYSSYIPICVCKLNIPHWKRSKFLLIQQHEILSLVSVRVDSFKPEQVKESISVDEWIFQS